MKISNFKLGLLFNVPALALSCSAGALAAPSFRRGDANLDGIVTFADTNRLVDALRPMGPALSCKDAGDANDDELLNFNDLTSLNDWLFRNVKSLPPPFSSPGADPTGDALDCADSTIAPPGPPHPGYKIEWAGDSFGKPGQHGLEFYLQATTGAGIDAFSVAYRLHKFFSLSRADFANTIFPAAQRDAFEASPAFRFKIVPSADPEYNLLLVAAVFVDAATLKEIQFAATRGAIARQRLLRVAVDLRPDAPLGFEVDALTPPLPEDLVPGGIVGLIPEFTLLGQSIDPGFKDRQRFTIDIGGEFLRGDANASADVDISDAISLLEWVFLGMGGPTCMDALDANDDSPFGGDPRVDQSDAIYILAWLFTGGPEPPAPYPSCGFDPTNDFLRCDSFPPCPLGGG